MNINLLSKRDKKRVFIRSLMVLNGITGTEVANTVGVTPAFVSMVISGKERSIRVQKAIAQALIERIAANKNEQKTARVRKRIALALGIREEDITKNNNHSGKAA
jgi:predicted transcriptional regulator